MEVIDITKDMIPENPIDDIAKGDLTPHRSIEKKEA
jgi:hypothetical protein